MQAVTDAKLRRRYAVFRRKRMNKRLLEHRAGCKRCICFNRDILFFTERNAGALNMSRVEGNLVDMRRDCAGVQNRP